MSCFCSTDPFQAIPAPDSEASILRATLLKEICLTKLPTLRIARVESLIVCNMCKKSFSSNRCLQRHQLQCGDKEPQLACPYCNLKFFRTDILRNHVLSSHRRKSKMRFLNRQTSTSKNSTTTTTSDTTDTPDPTPQRTGLGQLISEPNTKRSNKKIEGPVENTLKKYNCSACGKDYKRRYNLQRHRRVECGNEKSVHCKFCPVTFYHRSNLKDHLHRCHKVPKDLLPRILEQGGNIFPLQPSTG